MDHTANCSVENPAADGKSGETKAQSSIEIWRPIPGHDGAYDASSFGRIRSLSRRVGLVRGGTRQVAGRILRPRPNSRWGYLEVTLCGPDGHRTRKVADLVLAAFVGPKPPGLECCHGDGVRSNNRLDNLRYDTPAGNAADKARHGTILIGAANNKTKLTPHQVDEIRQQIAGGVPIRQIASKYGVYKNAIVNIRNGKAWAHHRSPNDPAVQPLSDAGLTVGGNP